MKLKKTLARLFVARERSKVADEAKTRFLYPLEAHLEASGLGHISEISDATSPSKADRGITLSSYTTISTLLQLRRGVSFRLATIQSRGIRKLEAYATQGHRMIFVEEAVK